jgi:diadenosine tetraphosphate (Ap4A) HIT family hydrolase
MLIRWLTMEDKSIWQQYESSLSVFVNDFMKSIDEPLYEHLKNKIAKFEILGAFDRMSESCLGVMVFSRENNLISWFNGKQDTREKEVRKRLLSTALRHLDTKKDIFALIDSDDYNNGGRLDYLGFGFVDTDVITNKNGNKYFTMKQTSKEEKQGGSFHFQFANFDKYSKIENCPCCNHVQAHESLVDIAQLKYSYVTAERIAQGKLFGKCHVLIKNHYVDFEDIPVDEMAGFMHEVQQVGKVLHRITQAVKINYEIHSNSVPHIHCHLFPRYLDDDFPSAPIDYRVCEPSPYESEEEFLWFVKRMKEEMRIEHIE